MAQAHGDRLSAVDASFLAQERANSHMHIGAVLLLRGPGPGVRRFPQPHPVAAAPRAALPAQAGVPAAGDRPADLDRRPELQPRVPRPPHRAARARLRGAAARAGRAHPLAAARSRQAAVGAVARAGARGRPLRADLQDPPRARRRRLRRRPDDRAVRPRRRCRRSRRTRASRGPPSPCPARWRSPPAGSRASAKLPFELAAGALSAATHPGRVAGRGQGGAGGHRRGRLGRPEPRAGHAAERADRPAPPALASSATTSRTSSSSRTCSAARSTTSC